MSRVYVDSDTGNWVHADTGNQISAWAVRNSEPHASEVRRRAEGGRVNTKYNERIAGNFTEEMGEDPGDGKGAPVPIGDFTQVEEQYVEEILKDQNYV